jgi:hypothetical protein
VDDKHRLDRWDEHARCVRVGLPRAKDKDVLDVEVGARKNILYGYRGLSSAGAVMKA